MNETARHWYLLPGDAVEHRDGRRAIFQQRRSAETISVHTEGNTDDIRDVSLIVPVDTSIVNPDRRARAEGAQKGWAKK